MNKLMITLGLLLIAGLSFAVYTGPLPGTWQYPWEGYAFDRYECQYYTQAAGRFAMAEYMYDYGQPHVTIAQLTQLDYIGEVLMGGHLGDMYHDYYATPFRASMAGYNADYSAFNALFNSMLRTYLQYGGSREYVAGMMGEINYYYNACIMGGGIPI